MSEQSPITVLDSLNLGLHQAMGDDPRVLLLGEDVLDPYGGAFKVTRGLSSQFPQQVITTPISEAGITGIAGGMALRGLRPVVEIMFGDFTTLIADQIINHLSKFQAMYHGKVKVPVVIRTPMGGRRGYGPTHSQSLEKFFLGVPGLTTLSPFHLKGDDELGTPGKLLHDAITDLDKPVFFVENKLGYLLKLLSSNDMQEFELSEFSTSGSPAFPFYQFTLRSAPQPQITLSAYGYMAHLALEAAHRLAYDEEIFCEVLVPTQLSPFELAPLFDSVRRTSRLLTIEEGTTISGWGAEVLAKTAEALGPDLKLVSRLGASGHVVPSAPDLEKACLPGVEDIVTRVREMV
jgi:pyruvate/2-oxoglutarate/acetoin dehydrogenase E1 component